MDRVEGVMGNRGPGKFNTNIDAYAYELTLDGGADEEASYPQEGSGWYGLVWIDAGTREAIEKIAGELVAIDEDEADLLKESVAVILFERSDGGVEADWFGDKKKAEKAWAEILVDTEEEDEGEMESKRRKKREVDFDDEDSVLAEMSEALDIDPGELKIENSHLTDFDTGTVYRIYFRGSRTGSQEWYVVTNDEQEHELAVAIVKQDLEQEPEVFDQGFIERHIDTDRLSRELESDVQTQREEDLREMRERDFWREWEGEGFDAPEENEDGDIEPPTEDQISDLAAHQTEEQLRDPLAYLVDIYGQEDAVKQAIEIAGIDVDAAAEDAVDTDGAAHFLSSYDGNTETTKSGLVFWRHN
jgi:hypothetical protein